MKQFSIAGLIFCLVTIVLVFSCQSLRATGFQRLAEVRKDMADCNAIYTGSLATNNTSIFINWYVPDYLVIFFNLSLGVGSPTLPDTLRITHDKFGLTDKTSVVRNTISTGHTNK